MATEEERCAEAKRLQAIDDAFQKGDLDSLRATVEDATAIPNGRMPVGIGACLVYAIYHSPLPFIRTFLDLGADPNAPADDGFPPLIAAVSAARDVPGTKRRTDVDQILRLLLEFGADPNQRGINDYTALHMAVVAADPLLVQVLLDGGANPELRTRIDDCETALEAATAAGLAGIVALLEHRGQHIRQRLRSGLMLLVDIVGNGEPVRRQQVYRIRLRMWLNNGDAVRWNRTWGQVDEATLEDEGATLVTAVRIDRRSLVNGLFYGIDGMRVGGMRRLEIAPHLAYGGRGVPEVIPPNTVLIAEITVLEHRA